MQPSQRIARVEVGNYRLPTADFAGLEDLHRELSATIRRHLPGVTASLLALPVPTDDGVTVDWYSDLGGQPLPLASLPPPRRAMVLEKLKDRLQSLQRLADELPRRQRGSEGLAGALRAATHYPGDEHVFAVGDEPVLTLWGFVRTRGSKRLTTPIQADVEGSRRRWLIGLGLTALSLTALAGAGWYAWMHEREQALRDDVVGALASGCEDPGALTVLSHRLDQLDPDGQLPGELRRQISAEQQRCAKAAALDESITAAGWDCAAIATLPRRLSELDPAREPVTTLTARLDQRNAICGQAARLSTNLDQHLGNCDSIASLASELPTAPTALPFPSTGIAADGGDEDDPTAGVLPEPLARLRARVDAELDLCANAATLSNEVAAASAQCERLLRLDGRLSELDASRPPLSPVRERLDSELARCARAEAFSRDLIDAQMDCTHLKALDERMRGEDMSQPPLLPVRERMDKALEQCQALDKLGQALRDADQDCGRLAALAVDIRDAHPNSRIFVDLRCRIARGKPKLKINVVDIAGANCAARATGGRVLRGGGGDAPHTYRSRRHDRLRGNCC